MEGADNEGCAEQGEDRLGGCAAQPVVSLMQVSGCLQGRSPGCACERCHFGLVWRLRQPIARRRPLSARLAGRAAPTVKGRGRPKARNISVLLAC